MFNFFRRHDEYQNKLIKQCPSCHGFIKSNDTKCRHCGSSTQLPQDQPEIRTEPEIHTESEIHTEFDAQPEDTPDFEERKFTI